MSMPPAPSSVAVDVPPNVRRVTSDKAVAVEPTTLLDAVTED